MSIAAWKAASRGRRPPGKRACRTGRARRARSVTRRHHAASQTRKQNRKAATPSPHLKPVRHRSQQQHQQLRSYIDRNRCRHQQVRTANTHTHTHPCERGKPTDVGEQTKVPKRKHQRWETSRQLRSRTQRRELQRWRRAKGMSTQRNNSRLIPDIL